MLAPRIRYDQAILAQCDARHNYCGQDGLVYALQVRSQLLGCIYLGPRPAEAYSAEERQLFERVAHQVAVALHALRLDAQRKLLNELAIGEFTSLSIAQEKTKESIGAAG